MTTPTKCEHAQTALAHELFAAAQLAPGEGIEDAVSRIVAAFTAAPAHTVDGEFRQFTTPDDGLNTLLNETFNMARGPKHNNMDTAMAWEESLQAVLARLTPAQPAAPQGVAYAELPEYLTLAVDRWFAENTGMGGCSDKDVRELAALFYGVHHSGGRESLDDALEVVESFGPEISGLNDTYARQILLADEVKRLRASHGQAPAGAAPRDMERELEMTQQFNAGRQYEAGRIAARNAAAQAAPAAGAVAGPDLQRLHDLLYSAQRQTSLDAMHSALTAARIELSNIRDAAPTPATQAASQPAQVLNEAFDCARAALNHCPDRASIAHILDTLRTRVDKAVLGAACPPADSVTAPAGGVAAHTLSDAQIEAMPVWRNFVGLWPESRREIADAVVDLLATPAAQADSVLEDAARWQWVAAHWKTVSFRFDKRSGLLAGFTLTVDATKTGDGAAAIEREIDAARKQGGKHDNP